MGSEMCIRDRLSLKIRLILPRRGPPRFFFGRAPTACAREWRGGRRIAPFSGEDFRGDRWPPWEFCCGLWRMVKNEKCHPSYKYLKSLDCCLTALGFEPYVCVNKQTEWQDYECKTTAVVLPNAKGQGAGRRVVHAGRRTYATHAYARRVEVLRGGASQPCVHPQHHLVAPIARLTFHPLSDRLSRQQTGIRGGCA